MMFSPVTQHSFETMPSLHNLDADYVDQQHTVFIKGVSSTSCSSSLFASTVCLYSDAVEYRFDTYISALFLPSHSHLDNSMEERTAGPPGRRSFFVALPLLLSPVDLYIGANNTMLGYKRKPGAVPIIYYIAGLEMVISLFKILFKYPERIQENKKKRADKGDILPLYIYAYKYLYIYIYTYMYTCFLSSLNVHIGKSLKQCAVALYRRTALLGLRSGTIRWRYTALLVSLFAFQVSYICFAAVVQHLNCSL